jgi:hypothetical protein
MSTPRSSPTPPRSSNCRTRRTQLSGALGRLLAVSENYPDLKSNQNFLALQSQLEGTENRIAVARKDYIEAVRAYNVALRTFPGRHLGLDRFPRQQADGRIRRQRTTRRPRQSEVLIAPAPEALDRAPLRLGDVARARARRRRVCAACAAFPALTGRVVDQANDPAATRASLEGKLGDARNKSGIQLVVATVLARGQEIEPYANDLFRAWKLGEAKKNNGVLFLVAPKDAQGAHRGRLRA